MGVELVAHGEHEVGQHAQLEQTEPPVLLVLTCVQILGLATQRHLVAELILALGYEYVALDGVVAMAFNHLLVVALV